MNRGPHADVPVDLTLWDAAELYDVTVKTLAQHLRCGQLVGFKSRGAAGCEWRVTRDALDDAGYRLRAGSTSVGGTVGDELAALRQELAAVRRAVAAERRRADDLDRRLGHALLQCGHLRSALAAATGKPQATEAVLDPAATRWLFDAISGGATMQKGRDTFQEVVSSD